MSRKSEVTHGSTWKANWKFHTPSGDRLPLDGCQFSLLISRQGSRDFTLTVENKGLTVDLYNKQVQSTFDTSVAIPGVYFAYMTIVFSDGTTKRDKPVQLSIVR